MVQRATPTNGLRASDLQLKGRVFTQASQCACALQAYSSLKKAEHAMKSVRYDGKAVSVVEPNLYAKRFTDFMRKQVFCGGNEPERPSTGDQDGHSA